MFVKQFETFTLTSKIGIIDESFRGQNVGRLGDSAPVRCIRNFQIHAGQLELLYSFVPGAEFSSAGSTTSVT